MMKTQSGSLGAFQKNMLSSDEGPFQNWLALANKGFQIRDVLCQSHERVSFSAAPHNLSCACCADALRSGANGVEKRLFGLDIGILDDHRVRIDAKALSVDVMCRNFLQEFGRIDDRA